MEPKAGMGDMWGTRTAIPVVAVFEVTVSQAGGLAVSHRAATRLALGASGFYLALAGVTAVLLIHRGHAEDLPLIVGGLAFSTMGALVVTRRPDIPMGWLLSAIALAIGITTWSNGYAGYAPDPASLPLGEEVAWLSSWGFYAWLWLAAIYLPLLFPYGRLPSARWRPVAWLAAIALILGVAGQAFKPGRLDLDGPATVDNPFGIGGAAGEALSMAPELSTSLLMICLVAVGASLIVRFRRARGDERQQLKWFSYVTGLAAAGQILVSALLAVDAIVDIEGELWADIVGDAAWALTLVALILGLPLAVGIAVLRYRLYDVDVVINRTLVYAGLTATLAGAYIGSVLLLQFALGPLTDQSDLAIAGSTLAVAALFRPARGRIQRAVDRRFYRRKYDAATTLERFSARLRQEVDLETVTEELRGVLAETMQPAHVSFWLRDGAQNDLRARSRSK